MGFFGGRPSGVDEEDDADESSRAAAVKRARYNDALFADEDKTAVYSLQGAADRVRSFDYPSDFCFQTFTVSTAEFDDLARMVPKVRRSGGKLDADRLTLLLNAVPHDSILPVTAAHCKESLDAPSKQTPDFQMRFSRVLFALRH